MSIYPDSVNGSTLEACPVCDHMCRVDATGHILMHGKRPDVCAGVGKLSRQEIARFEARIAAQINRIGGAEDRDDREQEHQDARAAARQPRRAS